MNIEKYFNKSEIHEYKAISPEDIPFSEAVIDACRANRCGRYGSCWTCQPGVGTLEELEKMMKSFKNAAVFTCKFDLEDSFDIEGMADGKNATKKFLFALKDELRSDENDFFALGCGGCELCKKCTYPDAPCRFPDKAIPAIEACGINVVELSRKIGIKYNNGPNTVTYFSIILFNN